MLPEEFIAAFSLYIFGIVFAPYWVSFTSPSRIEVNADVVLADTTSSRACRTYEPVLHCAHSQLAIQPWSRALAAPGRRPGVSLLRRLLRRINAGVTGRHFRRHVESKDDQHLLRVPRPRSVLRRRTRAYSRWATSRRDGRLALDAILSSLPRSGGAVGWYQHA
jgi:hypothetical protein